MKITVTLLSFIVMFALKAGAQNLTGIWKGHFVQKSFGYFEDKYRFEIQIEQLPNNALNGVTYSYKTTVFYGKADIKGIYTKKTNNIVLNETKLVEVKIGEESQPCLMTCYLEYNKMGTLETLTGSFTSRNLKDGSDCGNGRIYLERTLESDFFKEDFLVRRENLAKQKPPVKKPSVTRVIPKKPSVPKPAGIKPGAEENIVRKKAEEKSLENIAPPAKQDIVVAPPAEKLIVPKPDVIRKRSNELARTITTSAREIKIDLYDNGEIDGDIISVYHNNQLIVNKKMLAHKPITFSIQLGDDATHHEFVMVAENLGSIPPNTALMVITAGSKRHELFITSTEQKNAVVVIDYKPE